MLEKVVLRINNNFTLVIFITLIGCIFFQCKENTIPIDYEEKELDFTNTKQILLPLDSLTQPLIPYFQILEGDTVKYLFYNKFNKKVYVYDFFRENLVKKIPLNFDFGNESDINAFHYINQDSILFFPEYGDYYYVGNEDGSKKLQKKYFVDEDDKDMIESHWIKSSAPLININDKIYINNVFGWMATESETDKFLLIEHDVKTGNSEFILKHPKSSNNRNYENSTFRHLTYTQKGDASTILYSFNFDPYVYEYKGDKNNIQPFYCAPKDYQLPRKLKKNIDGNEAWLEFQTQFTFSRLVYDPYRKRLLRLALLPYSKDAIKAGEINPEIPKKPKFYVFDENYNLLGQFTLDKSKDYYFVNIFVTKEGVWIQRMLEDENYMGFDLIQYKS